MPPKWLEVIDLMVIGGLDFQPAMESVGYSEAYYKSDGHLIKQDPRFSKVYKSKKANIMSKSVDARTEHLSFLDSIRQDLEATYRDRIAAVKEYASICGWHSETIKRWPFTDQGSDND